MYHNDFKPVHGQAMMTMTMMMVTTTNV